VESGKSCARVPEDDVVKMALEVIIDIRAVDSGEVIIEVLEAMAVDETVSEAAKEDSSCELAPPPHRDGAIFPTITDCVASNRTPGCDKLSRYCPT
jgi:hypothetical protein